MASQEASVSSPKQQKWVRQAGFLPITTSWPPDSFLVLLARQVVLGSDEADSGCHTAPRPQSSLTANKQQ